MNFHDINFPKFMEIFAVGKPVFSTSLASTISGIELRNSDREYALQKYIFKNCCLSPAQFDEFNIFFRARKGRDCSFRFRDLLDQYAYKQVLAVGDGIIKEAQLFKEYRDRITSYMRKITKPVKDLVKLYIDDKLIQANIEYNTGVIVWQCRLINMNYLLPIFNLMCR
jgi:uncharacterized protein (TIGR02217 family)